MSEWGPPQTSETPHRPSNGIDALLGKLESLQHQINEMRSNLLRPAGISVEPDRIRFGGNVAIEGTLSLPAGIIDNDALANPIEMATAATWEQGFAITTTTTVFSTISFTVPDGFSRVLIAAVATGMGFNNSAADDWLYVAATLSGLPGGSEVYTGLAPGQGTSLAGSYFSMREGLDGGDVITLGVQMRTQVGTFTASTGNVARIDAQVTYLR